MAVLGDVASVVTAIGAGLQGYKCDPEWIKELRQKDDKKEEVNRSAQY